MIRRNNKRISKYIFNIKQINKIVTYFYLFNFNLNFWTTMKKERNLEFLDKVNDEFNIFYSLTNNEFSIIYSLTKEYSVYKLHLFICLTTK